MKKILPLFLLIFITLPVNVFAAGITGGEYNATDDIYYVYMDISGSDSFKITHNASGWSKSYNVVPGGDYTTLTCNGIYTYTFYQGDNVVATDNITASGISNENEDCKSDSSDGGGSDGGGSNCGCLFNTPGWQDYLDKIDDVIGAIPPAPNWDNVADKFRDSIVPSLIGGVGDLLGSPPGNIPAPSYPPGLDDGNLKEPTGREADGLDGFDAGDVKDNADGIDVREDDSGGFDINNPIENMPEQETFIPNEPENPTPEDPEEPENPAPTPEEPENPAPTPDEPENVAPTPEEPEIPAPTPEESENTAPTPEEPEIPTPTPGEEENEAPVPNEPGTGYPMPGGGGGSYPMPGGSTGDYPMPN